MEGRPRAAGAPNRDVAKRCDLGPIAGTTLGAIRASLGWPQSFVGDVAIATSTTWCGETTVSGNLSVIHGAVLTVQEAHGITVAGDALAELGATISANAQGEPGASGGGAGGGFIRIAAGGTVTVDGLRPRRAPS